MYKNNCENWLKYGQVITGKWGLNLTIVNYCTAQYTQLKSVEDVCRNKQRRPYPGKLFYFSVVFTVHVCTDSIYRIDGMCEKGIWCHWCEQGRSQWYRWVALCGFINNYCLPFEQIWKLAVPRRSKFIFIVVDLWFLLWERHTHSDCTVLHDTLTLKKYFN